MDIQISTEGIDWEGFSQSWPTRKLGNPSQRKRRKPPACQHTQHKAFNSDQRVQLVFMCEPVSQGLEAVEFGWKGDGRNALAFPQSRVCWGGRSGEGEGNLPKWERRSQRRVERARNVFESYQELRPPFMETWLLGWLMCFSKLQTPVIQDCGFHNYPSTTLPLCVNGQLSQTVKRAQKSQIRISFLKSGKELTYF